MSEQTTGSGPLVPCHQCGQSNGMHLAWCSRAITPAQWAYGWVCSKCGSSNAPNCMTCPHCIPPMRIT